MNRRSAKGPAERSRLDLIVEDLSKRMKRLEGLFNENMQALFGNHQQLKTGLYAAELNQRAMVKAIEGIEKIDWAAHYKEASAEILKEKQDAYRRDLMSLSAKADEVEKIIPELREGIAEETKASPGADRHAKVSDRFFNDLSSSIAEVRKASEAVKDKDAEVKIEDFDLAIKLFESALGLHRRHVAKKNADKAKESQIAQPTKEEVSVFGG